MISIRSLLNRISELNALLKRSYIKLFNISIIYYKIYGIKLKLNLINDVDRRLFLYGYEKDTMRYFRKLVKKDHVVLDIGANIGIYSFIVSERIGGSGKIYAFEPAHNAYNCLLFNIKLNGIKNVIPINSGVSNFTGKANFNICNDDAYNSLGNTPMNPVIKSEIINLTSVDDFVNLNKIKKVDIIKVDAEGAEYLIFDGAERTLSNHRPILFFEHNPKVTEGFSNSTADLIELIRFHKYELFEIKKGRLFKIEKDTHISASEIIAI